MHRMIKLDAGDRVCALTGARDVFRRSGVVSELLPGLARVELDDGGEELIGEHARGVVVEHVTGARTTQYEGSGWYVLRAAA